MKRVLALLLAAVLALGMLAGCGSEQTPARLSIVTTSFPLYDWVRNVVGDVPEVEIVWLMDSGVDPHSFQPSVEDLVHMADCDLFVYVGGESDRWAADALESAKNPELKPLNLLDALGDAAVEEEDVPGAEPEEEDEEGALDEHIWLSLKNAQACTAAIASALAEIDPDYAAGYRANAEAYGEKLRFLDEAYTEAVSAAALRTILVADRFPFRYLAEDYDLEYYAAFPGCSAETEASFQTVAGLAQKADELALPVILITDGANTDISETVLKNMQTHPEVRTLDSLQTVTAEDAANGVTYLNAMSNNLDVLKEALRCP